MRETLSMMGISPIAYWGSWYIVYTLMFGIVAICVGLVCSKVRSFTFYILYYKSYHSRVY